MLSAQDITISDEDIETRLDAVVSGYGSSPEIRKLFDTPQMRDNIRNELVMSHANEHLYAIGRGEDPAAAVGAMQAQSADDAQRAKERSERLLQYQSEDEAAAAALAADDQDDSAAVPETRATEGHASDVSDTEQAQEA